MNDDIAELCARIGELHAGYRDLLRAYAPPNPAYERERIIAQLANPRELIFVLGLLSEGENEAALLLDLICTVVAADPGAPTAHLADEAWYYLRTSIDPAWQLDPEPPSMSAALQYLLMILRERLARLRAEPAPSALADDVIDGRAELLRALRADTSVRR
jgi:hypothetical protein